VSDLGTVDARRPDRTLLITGNGRDAVSMSIAQQIGANILDLKAGVDERPGQPREDAAAGIRITASTTSPSSSRNRSPASATRS
jgi:multidrug efflux pump subunit AcrB